MNGGTRNNKAGRSFFEAIGICYSKYAVFAGRAPRSEYWWFALFQFLVLLAVCAMLAPHVLQDIRIMSPDGKLPAQTPGEAVIGGMYDLFSLATLLPSLGVAVRRLHDRNKSGWWWFIGLVPIIGPILLLIWFCQRGTPGENRFGPDPLGGN